MRKVLQFQGHRMFLVTEVFLQKNVQLQLRSIQTSCQLSENLSLFCFPVFWAIPVNQTSILQWMNMKGENSLTSRLLPFIGISLPCRHKGNKQVLLSAASSIPSQPLCTTIIPQLPPLKWKMCLSKAAVWKSNAFTHVRQARVLLSRIALAKKFLPLFQSAGFKCRFKTPDQRRHRHWRSENKWVSGVKTSTARRAFCLTWTQQLGLSTKGAPLCCWGYRWQVPHRCGCLKIKRSSVVCRGPSLSVIASSRQLSGKLEGPN